MISIRRGILVCLSVLVLGAIAHADDCKEGAGGLSQKEMAQILPQLDVEEAAGANEGITFTCRDPRDRRRVVIGTWIGSNLGTLYLATLTKSKATARALETGHYSVLDLLKDQSGGTFLLVEGIHMHGGPLTHWDMLIDFTTGKSQGLADESTDGTNGWCGNEETDPGEAEEPPSMDTASEMTYQLEPRPDGLKNLRYEITSKDCHTKKMTSEIRRYVPDKNGFHLEK